MHHHRSQLLVQACEQLSRSDSVLAAVIKAVGPCQLNPHTNYFQELVESIIGQQLSLQSAAAITARFVAFFGGTFPGPDQLLAAPLEDLRETGLSRPKITYIKDLARHVDDGLITFEHIESRTNEQIIDELTAVKGIGQWTAHMFLIFALGRLDVLAHGDLGIRAGVQRLYSLPKLPTPLEVQQLAKRLNWSPYESVAGWYVWQSLKL